MVITKLRNWYGKYERPISSLSLIGGFLFDALTLKRVDLFWENLWVIGHVVIVGFCIVLIHAIERGEGDEANPGKLHFWLVNLQQFFYGGIWSVFLVFYFRSSDIAVSWPFLLILALSFWANESLKRSFVRLTFQVSLFFLSVFCFAIFFVPVTLHRMGTGVFLLSGLASLVFITLFLLLIRYSSGRRFGASKWLMLGSIFGIYALVNTLFFTNILPPIPLSLKDGGVYYSVRRDGKDYLVTGEQLTWRNYVTLYPTFHYLPGQPVYVFSAVFLPNDLNQAVTHEWQRFDEQAKKWVTLSRVPISMKGGRDNGYRAYSIKTAGLQPGRWRVSVVTARGQVVGRIRFALVAAESLPRAVQQVKQ